MSEAPRRPTRRSVLAALAAATGLPAAGCSLRVGAEQAAALARLVEGAPSAAAVGRAVLEGRGETTAIELAREIHARLGYAARLAEPPELARRVGERIAAEIAAGDLEPAGGWRLPPTEARLAALAAIAEAARPA